MKMLALVLVVVGLVWGQMGTAADELTAEQAHYCDMVADGSWPDYEGTYDKACK